MAQLPALKPLVGLDDLNRKPARVAKDAHAENLHERPAHQPRAAATPKAVPKVVPGIAHKAPPKAAPVRRLRAKAAPAKAVHGSFRPGASPVRSLAFLRQKEARLKKRLDRELAATPRVPIGRKVRRKPGRKPGQD